MHLAAELSASSMLDPTRKTPEQEVPTMVTQARDGNRLVP